MPIIRLPRAVIIATVAVLVSSLAQPALADPLGSDDWQLTSQLINGAGGQVVGATAYFVAPADTSGSIAVLVEVVNSANVVVVKAKHTETFSGGHRSDQALTLPADLPDGPYAVRQGAWTGDWSTKLAFNNQTATFRLGTPVNDPNTTPDIGDPLEGRTFYGVNAGAVSQAQAWATTRPADAKVMSTVANQAAAQWFSGGDPNVAFSVKRVVDAAAVVNKVPVLVAYNITGRDCGHYSAGGAVDEVAYGEWVNEFAQSIGTSPAVVVIEPDALSQLCGDAALRYRELNAAVDAFAALPNVSAYLDAGHADWVAPAEMAQRLQLAGIDRIRGFATNVAFTKYNSQSITYGNAINASLASPKHFVIDTSRNGAGYPGSWCNPPTAALGKRPTAATGNVQVDAFLWIKTVGSSDGSCNGAPAAGKWWGEYALTLARNAGWS